MAYQKTINSSISCSGIGLHSGKKVSLTLNPAPPNTGIIFRRVDLPGRPSVNASLQNVVCANYATSLSQNGTSVQTVEHLLAALSGLNIDNLFVDLNSEEIPIMDGSAAPFVYLLHEVGIRIQKKHRSYLKIKKTIKVSDGDKYIIATPANEFKITYFINFDHPMLSNSMETVEFSENLFIKKISRARTFGFLKEVETLRRNGLAKGGSLDNAIVLGEYKILNGGLRFKEELVYHKIMDLVGDLFLMGMPVLGHIIAYKAGHALHTELAQEILQSSSKHVILSGLDFLRIKNQNRNQRERVHPVLPVALPKIAFPS